MEKKSAYDALMDAESTFRSTEGYMEKKAFPALIGWGARLLPRLLPYVTRAGQAVAGLAGRGASAIGRGVGLLNNGAVTALQTAKAHPFVSGMVGQQALSGVIDGLSGQKENQQQPVQQQPYTPAPQPVAQPTQTPHPSAQGSAPVIPAELIEQINKWIEEERHKFPYRGYVSGQPFGVYHEEGLVPRYQRPGYSNPLFQSPTQGQPRNGWTPHGTYINGRRYTGGLMGGDDPLSM